MYFYTESDGCLKGTAMRAKTTSDSPPVVSVQSAYQLPASVTISTSLLCQTNPPHLLDLPIVCLLMTPFSFSPDGGSPPKTSTDHFPPRMLPDLLGLSGFIFQHVQSLVPLYLVHHRMGNKY